MSVRILRSFAFIDLCGFTEYMEERGDDAAAEALSAMRFAIRRAAEQHGVRVAKWLGDGSMLVAVESASLLECLHDLWDELPGRAQLPVRGGMASGEVVIFEGDDYVGRPVNVAARLCSIAEPGQLLATDDCDPEGGPSLPLHVRGVGSPVLVLHLHDRDMPGPSRSFESAHGM